MFRQALLLALAAAANAGEFRDCDVCPVIVTIPAGEFTMGSTPAETERHGMPEHHAVIEWPQHAVAVGKPFAIGKFEVTVDEYRAFAEETGRDARECNVYRDGEFHAVPGSGWHNPPFEQDGNHPVLCVDWNDASEYAAWLSRRTGERYRLPSEAEWEYAARAGTTGARYWDPASGSACEHANVADVDSERPQFECADPWPFTSPVDYGIPNAFGLYNMLGNVGEFVADCDLPDYAVASGDADAVVDGDCSVHVGRGGSWWNDAYYLRAARRYSFAGAYTIVGFRIARDVDANEIATEPGTTLPPAR